MYLGVELETNVDGDLTDKAEEWKEACADFAMLKADATIGKGFEIVTAPCSLDIHATKWSELLSNTQLVHGMTSWNSRDACCGMHVHVSRKPISALTLGKLLVFINSPLTEKPITMLAGRNSQRWAKREEKKLTCAVTRCYECHKPKKRSESYSHCPHCKHRTASMRADAGIRYQAINLQNTETIEFRIFRGTLHLEHVLANIQFCDAAVRWAMQCSIQDCESWASFWSYVMKHQKTYKQLVSYMATKGY